MATTLRPPSRNQSATSPALDGDAPAMPVTPVTPVPGGTGPAADARRARWGVSTIFFLTGIGTANWAVRIPAVQDELGLTASQLGYALLGVSAGALVAMPVAGRLVARFGSRPVTWGAIAAFALGLALPPLATTAMALALTLFVVGLSNGLLDVAMNSQAAAVQARYGKPVMSGIHALYSGGGLVGAAIGGRFAASRVDTFTHLAIVGAAMLVVACLAAPRMLPAKADATPGHRGFVRPTRSLAALGFVAFCVLFGEGAMGNWSAVYMRDVGGAGPGLAAAGFAAFSLCMAIGRLVGDALTTRLGPMRLVRGGAMIAAAGVAAALVLPHPAVIIVGFGAIGAGFAASFPLMLSAAGRTRGVPSGGAIAVVSMCGYSGLLAGPPLIGTVAGALTLRGGLGLVLLSCLVIVTMAGRVLREER